MGCAMCLEEKKSTDINLFGETNNNDESGITAVKAAKYLLNKKQIKAQIWSV